MRRNYIFLALDGDTKEIRDISKVSNGLGCGCICGVCNTPLEARQGNVNIWHFAHTKIKAGQNCFDGAIDLIKKYIIDKLKCGEDKIKVPRIDKVFSPVLFEKTKDLSFKINDKLLSVELILKLNLESRLLFINVIFDHELYQTHYKNTISDYNAENMFSSNKDDGFLIVSIESLLYEYIEHHSNINFSSFVDFAFHALLNESYCKSWMYIPNVLE